MRRRAIPWATALFFITIFSCEKNKLDPECKDASCCDPDLNEYVEYITDIPAHLNGPPQYSTYGFVVPFEYPTDTVKKAKSNIFLICDKSLDKIKGFVPDIEPDDKTKIVYRYKISGKLLVNRWRPQLTGNPLFFFYIDKIEKIKP